MQQPLRQTKTASRWGLIQAREGRGWTQKQLADEIGSTFVSISRWETGARTPSPYFRRKLVTTFQRSEEELDLLPLVIEKVLNEEPSTSLQPLGNQSFKWGPTLATGGLTIIALIAAGIAWRAPNFRREFVDSGKKHFR